MTGAVLFTERELRPLAIAVAPLVIRDLPPSIASDDRTAPPKYLCRLVDDLTTERKGIDLRVVPGDHHLTVRRPEQVADVIAELLAAPEATP